MDCMNCRQSFWVSKVKPVQKCLKPAFFLMDSSGTLRWFQKEVWLYVSLWENEPASHWVYYLRTVFYWVSGLNRKFQASFNTNTACCSFSKLLSHLEWNRWLIRVCCSMWLPCYWPVATTACPWVSNKISSPSPTSCPIMTTSKNPRWWQLQPFLSSGFIAYCLPIVVWQDDLHCVSS